MTRRRQLYYGNDTVSSTVTRRQLIGVAAGAGAGYALAGPVLGAIAGSEPECVPAPPGFATGAIAVAPGGRVAWTADSHGTTITARPGPGFVRGRSIDVGGAPVDLAIAPSGHRALVTTAFYDRPGLASVELRSGRVARSPIAAEPGAVAFAADGAVAYVVGGGPDGTLSRVDPRNGHVERTVKVGSHPRGLALTPDGAHALVALNGDAALAVVDLRKRMHVHRIQTAAFPSAVAATGANHAIVTHDGFHAHTASIVDLEAGSVTRTRKVGADPAAVAASPSRAVIVTRQGRALVLGRRGAHLSSFALGGNPAAVALAGASAWVADARTGRLRRLRIGGLG